MQAELSKTLVDQMWPRTKRIYEVLDGFNVMNSILDEPVIDFGFTGFVGAQSISTLKFTINIYEQIFAIDLKEEIKELQTQIIKDHFKEVKFVNRKAWRGNTKRLRIVFYFKDESNLMDFANLLEYLK